MLVIESAGITDIGRKRKGNEDSLIVDDDLKLYIVADGMGGHRAGEVASRMVVESIHEYMKNINRKNDVEKMAKVDEALSHEANHLNFGVYKANWEVYCLSDSDESYKGMGSTVSSVYFTDNTFIAINVGDSPIYLIRKGNIETLSMPHTMMAEHAALAPEGSKPLGKQYRHLLTRAMGINETVNPDIREDQVYKGDIFVIASDGLSDKVTPEEILDMASNDTPDMVCRSLVDLANEQGGEDNITVIVLNIKNVTDEGGKPAIEESQIVLEEGILRDKQQISVDYDTEDGSYRSFIQNIDVNGIFIETRESFYIGQEISLTFSIGEDQDSCTISGTVADRVPQGIEVKFKNLTQQERDFIESIQKKI